MVRSICLLMILMVGLTLATIETTKNIEVIGLTPDGKLVAWLEKGEDGAGEFERFYVANSTDMTVLHEYVISDAAREIVATNRGKQVKEARKSIKALGINSGRGTMEVSDIYGNYRQLALSARLYLKVEPNQKFYRLEVFDELSSKSRIIKRDGIDVDIEEVRGRFELRAARLSRDRSTCAVVVRSTFQINGEQSIDKIYTFRVFGGG